MEVVGPTVLLVITPSVEVLLAVTVMGKLTSVPLGAKIGEFVEAEPIAVVVVNASVFARPVSVSVPTVVVAGEVAPKEM